MVHAHWGLCLGLCGSHGAAECSCRAWSWEQPPTGTCLVLPPWLLWSALSICVFSALFPPGFDHLFGLVHICNNICSSRLFPRQFQKQQHHQFWKQDIWGLGLHSCNSSIYCSWCQCCKYWRWVIWVESMGELCYGWLLVCCRDCERCSLNWECLNFAWFF